MEFARGHAGSGARHGKVAAAVLVCLALSQCSKAPTEPTPNGPGPTIPGPTIPSPTLPVPNPGPETFTGAGDIAMCSGMSQQQGRQDDTARLLESIGGLIFTLGDNAYPNGSAENYNNCYARSWGRFLGRTKPVPGNHEYNMNSAGAAYFNYFGDAAGFARQGYYSFDMVGGNWHVIALNSNANEPGSGVSVGPNSPQGTWLQQDLAANRSKCTLAYWHHPLFTSGQNGENLYMRPFFQMLYDAGAEVVLTGHDHLYERFAPQTPDGRLDPARGIRQFVVGTGGAVNLYQFFAVRPNSEFRDNRNHGVLKMTLMADSYSWEFVTPSGVLDPGPPTACH